MYKRQAIEHVLGNLLEVGVGSDGVCQKLSRVAAHLVAPGMYLFDVKENRKVETKSTYQDTTRFHSAHRHSIQRRDATVARSSKS